MLLPDERAASLKAISDQKAFVQEEMDKFRASLLVEEEKTALAEFDTSLAAYYAAVDDIITNVEKGDNDFAIKSILTGGEASNARKAWGAAVDTLSGINVRIAEETHMQGNVTFANSVRLLLIIAFAAFLLAIATGIVFSNSLSKPLGILVKIATSVSEGDLVRDLDQKVRNSLTKRKDEVGDIAKSFNQVIIYLQEMGQAAESIAKNDLSKSITPKSEKDELGNAFVAMIDGLRDAVSQINDSAGNLSAASEQLASAANQAGQATNQISTTVQQVAKGTADQSASINNTASSIDQMSKPLKVWPKAPRNKARLSPKLPKSPPRSTLPSSRWPAMPPQSPAILPRPPKPPAVGL